jgi:hypothetical protein
MTWDISDRLGSCQLIVVLVREISIQRGNILAGVTPCYVLSGSHLLHSRFNEYIYKYSKHTLVSTPPITS